VSSIRVSSAPENSRFRTRPKKFRSASFFLTFDLADKNLVDKMPRPLGTIRCESTRFHQIKSNEIESNRTAPTGPIANGFAASGVLPLAHRRFSKMKNTRFYGVVSNGRAQFRRFFFPFSPGERRPLTD